MNSKGKRPPSCRKGMCRAVAVCVLSALWPTDWSPRMHHSTQVWAEALLSSGMKLWRGWDLWELRNLWISLQLPYPDHSPPLDVKHVFDLKTMRLASVPGRLFCFKLLQGLKTDLSLRVAQHSAWKSLWLMWICETVSLPLNLWCWGGPLTQLTMGNVYGANWRCLRSLESMWM